MAYAGFVIDGDIQLAIGANTTWLVTILMVFSFPVAYPVGKLLDCLFGEEHATYYRRAELSTLVGMHKVEGDEKGKHSECCIVLV